MDRLPGSVGFGSLRLDPPLSTNPQSTPRQEFQMKHARYSVLAGALALTAVGAFAATEAPAMPHFKLIEPVSWIVENDRGDPQKAGPCGGTNTDWGKETLVVNQAKGGEKMHIKLLETVYHPGHFRVALAVNSMNELPPDPVAVTKPAS